MVLHSEFGCSCVLRESCPIQINLCICLPDGLTMNSAGSYSSRTHAGDGSSSSPDEAFVTRWVIVTDKRMLHAQEEPGWGADKEKVKTLDLARYVCTAGKKVCYKSDVAMRSDGLKSGNKDESKHTSLTPFAVLCL